ncbi:MAG TPA: hypothetical protein VEL03_05345 [Streptosporangiaceae bacterium]|nr:hypothetical protein [Streptosporangiaceae bacterium]
MSPRRYLALGACAAAIIVAVSLAPRVTASAQSSIRPADTVGFWYGTDSSYIAVPGPAPYKEPVIGGSYGGYIGMIGNWAHWQGCHGRVVWSKTDARRAATNLASYHRGVGVGGYWFMAGPGVDPHYTGTSTEAAAWGREQAAAALADISKLSSKLTYPVVILDVELPGDAPSYTPAPDNGWNAVYTSPCSGVVSQDYVPASLDRADFNGFADYITAHSAYKAGVYSAPGIWKDIFGTGKDASLTNTYEWTYTADTASLSDPPDGWCLAGTSTCAQFFGGITRSSKYALMWQWSGGGGTYNGVGDFDQIDASRTP